MPSAALRYFHLKHPFGNSIKANCLFQFHQSAQLALASPQPLHHKVHTASLASLLDIPRSIPPVRLWLAQPGPVPSAWCCRPMRRDPPNKSGSSGQYNPEENAGCPITHDRFPFAFASPSRTPSWAAYSICGCPAIRRKRLRSGRIYPKTRLAWFYEKCKSAKTPEIRPNPMPPTPRTLVLQSMIYVKKQEKTPGSSHFGNSEIMPRPRVGVFPAISLDPSPIPRGHELPTRQLF
jgi:hypothetical protein